MKNCPNCKLINPVSAQYCDCGYNFHSGAIEESHAVTSNRKKSSFVFGVDVVSMVLATPLSKIFSLVIDMQAFAFWLAPQNARSGAAWVAGILVGAFMLACFYTSSFITNRISVSSLSQGKKVAVYISLVVGYLVVAVILLGLAEVIREQQSR